MAPGTVGRARGPRLNLAAIRRNRGLSLDDIAGATKISIRYLRAIEDERFDILPGLIYSTSYIRQYAKAIDYDPGVILAAFNQDTRSHVRVTPTTTDALCTRRLRWERYWRMLSGVTSPAGGQG